MNTKQSSDIPVINCEVHVIKMRAKNWIEQNCCWSVQWQMPPKYQLWVNFPTNIMPGLVDGTQTIALMQSNMIKKSGNK